MRLARGDLAEAMRVLEQGLALSRAERLRIWYPAFAVLLAQSMALAGRALAAVPMVQQALPVPTDAIYFAPFAVVAATEVYVLAGQRGDAEKFGARALELARRKRERGYEAWAMRVLGDIAASREPSDRAAAEVHYRDALSRANALGMRPLQARCHLDLGTLHLAAGARAKAHESLATAAALLAEMGMGFWLARCEAAARPG